MNQDKQKDEKKKSTPRHILKLQNTKNKKKIKK